MRRKCSEMATELGNRWVLMSALGRGQDDGGVSGLTRWSLGRGVLDAASSMWADVKCSMDPDAEPRQKKRQVQESQTGRTILVPEV